MNRIPLTLLTFALVLSANFAAPAANPAPKEPPPALQGKGLRFVEVVDKRTPGALKVVHDDSPLFLAPATLFDGKHVKHAHAFKNAAEGWGIMVNLDKVGADKLWNATRRLVGKRMAIVLDTKVLSAPVVNEPIPGGMLKISGDFTEEKAKELALQIKP